MLRAVSDCDLGISIVNRHANVQVRPSAYQKTPGFNIPLYKDELHVCSISSNKMLTKCIMFSQNSKNSV